MSRNVIEKVLEKCFVWQSSFVCAQPCYATEPSLKTGTHIAVKTSPLNSISPYQYYSDIKNEGQILLSKASYKRVTVDYVDN